MSKVKGQNYMHGAAILTIGVVIMKILGFIYKIPLGNILGDEGFSMFTSAYNIYYVFFPLATAGLPVALSRLVAEADANGRAKQEEKTFRVALLTFFVIGAVFALILYLFPNWLADNYLENPDAAPSIRAMAPSILLVCLVSAYRGYCQGNGNMLPTTVDEVLEVADRLLKPCEDQKLETVFPEETLDIVREETVESAAVGQPLFNLGIKCQPRQGLDNLRAEMLADITMQTLSGSSSPLYQEMLQSGLVNDSFSSEVFNGDGFFTMIFGGESRDPQAVREKVTAAILDAQKNGLDEVMFNESKKSAYGELVRKLGNVSAVTNTLVAAHMAGCGLYDPMQVLSEMTLNDCNRFLREEVDVRRMSLSVITPAE